MRKLFYSLLRWILLLFPSLAFGILAISNTIGSLAAEPILVFGVCILLQSLTLLWIIRRSPRKVSSTFFALAGLVGVFLISDWLRISFFNFPSGYFSVWEAASTTLFVFLYGFPISVLLRTLLTLRDLREMRLFGWRGLALAAIILLSTALFYLSSQFYWEDYIIGAIFCVSVLLTASLTWKLAADWWPRTDQVSGILAVSGGLTFLLFFIQAVFINLDSRILLAVTMLSLTVALVAWSIAGVCGLHFTGQYLPRPQIIHQLGLVNWRGGFFLGILGLGCFLAGAGFLGWRAISLDAGWPIFWILSATIVALFWGPAKVWREERNAVRMFTALVILLVVLGLIPLILAVFAPYSSALFQDTTEIIFIELILLAYACGLVALLPWLRHFLEGGWLQLQNIEERLPAGWIFLVWLLFSIGIGYYLIFVGSGAFTTYLIIAGIFILGGAFLAAQFLARFKDRRWAGVLGLVLGFLSLLGIITADIWGNYLYDSWGDFLYVFLVLFPILAAFSFGILSHFTRLMRAVIVILLLVATETIFYSSQWDIGRSGLATGLVWVAVFVAGWLLISFVPPKIQTWTGLVWSGGLLLAGGSLLLPIFFRESGLVSYRLSLPVWASHFGMDFSSIGRIFLPIAVVFVLSAMLFALLLRSGQTLFARSRLPKPEALVVSVLILGACLTLASSYNSTRKIILNRLSGGTWGDVRLPSALQGDISVLFADRGGAIWVGADRAGVARFNGREWQAFTSQEHLAGGGVQTIYEDPQERIWVVTSGGLTAFDRQTGNLVVSYDLSESGEAGGLDSPLSLSHVHQVFQDSQGSLWIAGDDGLLRIPESEDGQLILSRASWLSLSSGVFQVGEDPSGHLWFRTDSQLFVSPLTNGERARKVGPQANTLVNALDLTAVSSNTPITLTLAARLESDVVTRFQFSVDGSGVPCPSQQVQASQKALVSNCVFTGPSEHGFPVTYDLSPYAGRMVQVQLSTEVPAATKSPGSWYLIGAQVQIGARIQPIPLESWSGAVDEEASWAVLTPDESAVPITWQGPFYTFEDGQGSDYYGSAFSDRKYRLGSVGLYPLPSEGGSLLLRDASVVFQDDSGNLWKSSPETPLGYSADGQEWRDASAFPGVEIQSVSAMTQQSNGNLLFAGQARFNDSQGAGLRYFVGQYNLATGFQRVYDTENNGLAVGEAKELVTDRSGDVWVLLEDQTYVPNSIFWYLLPALGLIGLGYLEYVNQPPTQAQRLGKRLQADPQAALHKLYAVLQNDPNPGEILCHVVEETPLQSRQDWTKLAAALEVIAPDRPLPSPQALITLADQLQSVSDIQDAPMFGALCRLLAEADQANTAARIAIWPLRVIRSQSDSPPMLISETLQPLNIPGFIGARTVDALEYLSNVAILLGKYAQVDNSQDKLVYLADAVGMAERAVREADGLLPPEQKILRAIATNWNEIVRTELNNFSGRAELRLELRTRQIRRAAQVTLALRLQNTGRAVAENVRITLQPGNEFSLLSDSEVRLLQLSSGSSAAVEFTIGPAEIETARVVCHIRWDDRVASENVAEFADVVRFYKTADEFRSIPNPYIVGHPVKSAEMFHGREDVFQFIAENLTGPVKDRTLVLHGQRRTGKTSILYQLLGGRLGPQFIPVLIDMQELALPVNSTDDFFSELAYHLTRAASKAGITLDEPARESFASAPTRMFNRFIDTLEEALGERRIILMFDEFELLERKIAEGKLDADLLNYFRSLMQHRESLIVIFTGTHRLEEMSHDYWSILFNIALYRKISFLSQAEAERLIREPVASSLDIDALAVEKIIQLTKGHPYFIQLLCWALVMHCNEQERNYATINDVNDALHEILISGEAHFAYIWKQASSEERMALVGLAHTLRPGKAWARPSEVLDTLRSGGASEIQQAALVEMLDQLAEKEVLEVAGDGMLRYRFQIEVLRLWVAENQSVAALVERGK